MVPWLFARSEALMIGSYPGKRLLDLTFSLPALLSVAPVMMIAAVLVLLFHGRPVLFVQERPGLHGRPFKMLKFRSMTNATDAVGNLLPAEHRITRFGRFMRRKSLDELPELFNVIRGEMSLVGPRPLLMQYLPLYSGEQMRRHQAKPGITGWAQVNGRNNITWEEKFALDNWYVDNASFWLDLRTILRTVISLCNASDVNKDGFEGMDTFQGSKSLREVTSVGMPIHQTSETHE